MDMPISYGTQEFINYFNMQPSEVKGRANTDTEFHKRYLYNKLYSTLKFNIPTQWDLNFFRFWLFNYGSIAVIYTREYGWIIQPYSIQKLNLYYNPQIITVYNQFLPEVKTGVIGINAGIIKVLDDYFGLDDIVTRYAVQLAQVDKDININLMNSNVTALFEAENKKQADEIKEAYGQATTGKPLVIVNRDVTAGRSLNAIMPDVSKNYIVDKLLMARRGIINAYLTEIGIRNANYEKKERMNSQEITQNEDETSSIISVIYDNIKSGMRKVNKISGLNLSVELRYDYEEDTSWDE